MRDRGLQKIDREREYRKDQSINNIQKTVPGLSLPARKNHSNPNGGLTTLGMVDGGAGADAALFYQVSKQSLTPVFVFFYKITS